MECVREINDLRKFYAQRFSWILTGALLPVRSYLGRGSAIEWVRSIPRLKTAIVLILDLMTNSRAHEHEIRDLKELNELRTRLVPEEYAPDYSVDVELRGPAEDFINRAGKGAGVVG